MKRTVTMARRRHSKLRIQEVILNENDTYECNVRVKERQTEKTMNMEYEV